MSFAAKGLRKRAGGGMFTCPELSRAFGRRIEPLIEPLVVKPIDGVTELLQRAGDGDRDAFDRAYGLVYEQLSGLAHAQLRRESEGHTLDTGALVHEAYARLGGGASLHARDTSHFLAIAATAMRRILVDHARRVQAEKRGGALRLVSLSDVEAVLGADRDGLLVDLDEALTRLAVYDARQAQVVECRYFGGLTEAETASTLGVGLRTVKRDWAKARSWLYRELNPEDVA